MKYRWVPTPSEPLLTAQLAREFQIPVLLAQCLVNRQLDDRELVGAFLEPKLRRLADPFLLPDMLLAVERLLQARAQGQRVVLFGDYDVDGVTATALLLQFLRTLGWRVDYYLPQRLTEGYGLTWDSVERCLDKTPARLLLAVDCGSNAGECIGALGRKGVDVIVLDHHQVSSPAPPALALVNPQARRLASEFQPSAGTIASTESLAGGLPKPLPFAELCSAGLAFKLAHALLKHARAANMPGAAEYDLRPLLDLVALGTIADLVPLKGENRILVTAGLDRLNRTTRPGLLALKAVARCHTVLSAHDVGFQLAPRLNAAGRLETAEDALRLLLAERGEEAQRLALALDAQNRERQRIEREIAEAAVRQVHARFKPEEDFVIVEGDALWHVGVVGIVASRVLRQFNRPTIIIGGDGAEWRGSGRSMAGFDLAAALGECADLLVRHGGHALAAGLTIHRDNVDRFRVRLNQLARQGLSPEQLCPSLRLDAEVTLAEITLEALAHLSRLDPTGQANPPVQLFVRDVQHQRPLQRVGAEKQHVKMWVTDGVATREAVWWGGGGESLPVGRYDLAFTPQVDQFNGNRCVQLKVLDWRPSQSGQTLSRQM